MNFLEKLDKRLDARLQMLVEKALGPGPTVAFLEMYARALRDIEEQVQSVGGRRVFPFKLIVIRVTVRDSEQLGGLASVLNQRRRLSSEIRSHLAAFGCEPPTPLRVDAQAVSSESRDVLNGYEISFYQDLPPQPALNATVLKGRAEGPMCSFTQDRVNIGRLQEVLDESRRLVRQNHLVFVDVEQGVNATVSREHAHIHFDPDTGWYRIYDDGSKFGTRLRRNGQVIEVPNGPNAGAWLRSGDEVQIGQARFVVRFEE